MDKKTVIHFCGELAKEFPNLILESLNVARGDKIEIVNTSIRIFDDLTNVLNLEISKRNNRQQLKDFESVKSKIENSYKEEMQKIDASLLKNQKERIEDYKLQLEAEYKNYKIELLNSTIDQITIRNSANETIVKIENRMRNIINEALIEQDRYLKIDVLTKKNRLKAEECYRLLQVEYNKLCKKQIGGYGNGN